MGRGTGKKESASPDYITNAKVNQRPGGTLQVLWNGNQACRALIFSDVEFHPAGARVK